MTQPLPEGTVTVLFTDVEGSTALTARRGDEAARALLRAQGELVRDQVKAHSGHEVKSMGDGFMVAFASARRAIACAVDIQRAIEAHNRSGQADEQVRVRIGLHTGEVIQEEADLFGQAVNAAARVAAKASGGQILISDTVKGVLGPAQGLQLIDRGRFRLKGFPERWRLHEVVWREEVAAVAPAPLLTERTPFVGREAERAELRRLLDQAIGGHGALVMLGGEPGVGKTRLCEELMAEGRQRGMTALIGRCYEMEGAQPYIPFVEMVEAAARMFPPQAVRDALGDHAPEVARLMPELRHMFPDIAEPPDMPPEQQRRYLFNGMREFIARSGRAQPLLLVLDDLHWADDATMLLVQHIAQQLGEMAVLVVGTYRDVELDVARPLARALEELLRQRLAQRVSLKRFSEAGVETMLHGLSGQTPPAPLVKAIYAETEGNPFFVEEVFKHLAEEGKLFDAEGRWRSDLLIGELDVPEGVRLVISRRLQRVSEDCRRVLTVAAVIGRGFSFELLQALGEVESDALLDAVDEAERAHLITSVEDGHEARFTFAHELIRQTLVSDVSHARRQRVHLRVAEAMEQLYAMETTDAAEVHARRHAEFAHHLYQAGSTADTQKTVRYLIVAGDQAQAAGAFEEALRHYENAIPLQPAGDQRGLAGLLFKRGLARRNVGHWDEAMADWHKALALYAELGDNEAIGRISCDIAQQLLFGSRFLEALETSQRALLKLGKRLSADRCRLLAYCGLALSLGGYHTLGNGLITQAMTIAERLNDSDALGVVLALKAVHHYCYMQTAECAEVGLRAASLLRSTGNLWDLAGLSFFVWDALRVLARFEEAEAIRQEGEPLAIRLGHPAAPSALHNTDPIYDVLRKGNIDLWEAYLKQELERATRLGNPGRTYGFHLFLSVVDSWRGRWEESLKDIQEAIKVEEPGPFAGFASARLFLMRAYVGDKERALAVLQEKRAAPAPQEGARVSLSLVLRTVRVAMGSGLGLTVIRSLIQGSATAQRFPRPGRASTLGVWTILLMAVEGLAVLGERSRAAKLYPLVSEAMARGDLFRGFDGRLLNTIAGIAAAAGRQWEKAEEHYQAALRQAHELPHVIEQPEARRFYARMLLDRDRPGDRDKAFRLLTEAVAMYKKIGMPKHVEMAEALLAEC